MIEIAIYGAGLTGAFAKLWLEKHGHHCQYFIDDYKSKTDQTFKGVKVLPLSSALTLCREKNLQIFIASINGWHELKRKLDESNYTNYKVFYYSTYILDERRDNQESVVIDDKKISKVEKLFKNEYSKLLYKSILKKRQENINYFVNLHNQYFAYYTPRKDDIIIDCGAGIGDFTQRALTSLTTGRIYTFEPDPIQFHNLAAQFQHTHNVYPVNAGVYHKETQMKFTNDLGQGANKIDGNGDDLIHVIDLDSFSARHNLQKVDFIKMDIEGMELNAIIGAENIIKNYKPFLSISLYHKIEDLWTIPTKIQEIRGDYDFFLEHHSIGMGETVLYAI